MLSTFKLADNGLWGFMDDFGTLHRVDFEALALFIDQRRSSC